MAGLRDRGYVRSAKGRGGGWVVACDLSAVSLLNIYDALGSPSLFAIGHRTEEPECVVEQAVNGALGVSFAEAERALVFRLGQVTLKMLSDAVDAGLAARTGQPIGSKS